MAERGKIGLREVRALEPGQTKWDGAVKGFGIRRQEGHAVAYVLKYRTAEGRQRWHTIGRHGAAWTPEIARKKAKELLGEVAKERDPSAEKQAKRHAETVAELCDLYMVEAEAGRVLKRNGVSKKASTLAIDRGRVERHIKPILGALAVVSVTRRDVERFLHDIAEGRTKARVKTRSRGVAVVTGGKTAANRSVGLLGAIFTYGVRQGMRPDNPVHGAQRFADGKRERRLTDEEYAALGQTLRGAAEANFWPPALAVVRFLAFTGWRRGEALNLRWSELDLARRTANLDETKSGRSLRPLSRLACEVLNEMAGFRAPKRDVVFPSTGVEGPMRDFRKRWIRVVATGQLSGDVTPHVLRHSFASMAADLGYSEATIAAMVGHKGRTMTSRYTHSADAVLLAAADVVAGKVAGLMGEFRLGKIVPMPSRSNR